MNDYEDLLYSTWNEKRTLESYNKIINLNDFLGIEFVMDYSFVDKIYYYFDEKLKILKMINKRNCQKEDLKNFIKSWIEDIKIYEKNLDFLKKHDPVNRYKANIKCIFESFFFIIDVSMNYSFDQQFFIYPNYVLDILFNNKYFGNQLNLYWRLDFEKYLMKKNEKNVIEYFKDYHDQILSKKVNMATVINEIIN